MRNPYYPLPQQGKTQRRKRTGWITGPDPKVRDKYYAFLKHRAQAKYRKESYELDFEDWLEFWTDSNWNRRGRGAYDVCLAMKDPDFGWCKENCIIINRKEQCQRVGGRRREQNNVEF